MLAIFLCFASFVTCYFAGRRSLANGIVALLVFGYFYGIVRANLLSTFSHFIFDAGLLGLYAARFFDRSRPGDPAVRSWLIILIAWPTLLCLLPFQPLMISLVGLRGNIFFLPMLLLASRLADRDLTRIACGISVLNLVALAFAGAEYFTGVPRFYPYSAVTEIIYMSSDVEGGYFRIPAIFSSAHSYGGAMVLTLPLLAGAWMRGKARIYQMLAAAGIVAALLGILMSATRVNFVFGCATIMTIFFTSPMRSSTRVVFLLMIAAVGFSALNNSRLQRFKSLDTEFVTERIAGSVNRGFWEILVENPMGNGLGGGGTSIPYFLQGQVRNPIGLESEYARILCEQGIIGLLLWISFIFWIISRWRVAFVNTVWKGGRRLALAVCMIQFASAMIGVGLLTAIPATILFLLNLGWAVTPVVAEKDAEGEIAATRSAGWSQRYGHAY